MPKRADPAVARLRDVLRDVWLDHCRRHPAERVYAFGVYTTESAEYLAPAVCGEDGLAQVARRYMKKHGSNRGYKTLGRAKKALRWSVPDSPYHADHPLFDMAHCFGSDVDPLDLPEPRRSREIARRFDACVAALRALDAEGLFGRGKARERIVLLIEAGDRTDAWVTRWAKLLNPKRVYDAWGKRPPETIGTFTEVGAQEVYETRQLALTADGSMIAAAVTYSGVFFFSTKRRTREIAFVGLPRDLKHAPISAIGLSADGGSLAILADCMSFSRGSLVWIRAGAEDGDDAITTSTVPLPARGTSMGLHPTADWAVVGDEKGRLQVHRVGQKKPKLLTPHTDSVRGLAISRDGRRVVSADGRTTIVWDTRTWTPIRRFRDGGDAVDLDPSARRIVSTMRYGRIRGPRQGDRATIARVFDARTGSRPRDVAVPGHSISVAKFSPDGKRLVLAVQRLRRGDEDVPSTTEAVLVTIRTGAVTARLRADFESINDFAFLPDGRTIAVAVFGHTRRPLVLWDAIR